jgi:hypothetical protein
MPAQSTMSLRAIAWQSRSYAQRLCMSYRHNDEIATSPRVLFTRAAPRNDMDFLMLGFELLV